MGNYNENNIKDNVVTYMKHKSDFQMHLGDVKCLIMDNQINYLKSKNKNIRKCFYERYDRNTEYSKMIDFLTEDVEKYPLSETTVVIWSMFDLIMYDFYTLWNVFSVVSILETKEQLVQYNKLIKNYIDAECECIKRTLNY